MGEKEEEEEEEEENEEGSSKESTLISTCHQHFFLSSIVQQSLFPIHTPRLFVFTVQLIYLLYCLKTIMSIQLPH